MEESQPWPIIEAITQHDHDFEPRTCFVWHFVCLAAAALVADFLALHVFSQLHFCTHQTSDQPKRNDGGDTLERGMAAIATTVGVVRADACVLQQNFMY